MSSIFNTQNNFTIGTRVITTGYTAYHSGSDSVPIGTIGTIVHIMHRYAGTPNEYKQYKLHFDGFREGDSLTHLYNSYDLKLATEQPTDSNTILCKSATKPKSTISIGDFVKVSGYPAYPNIAINGTIAPYGSIGKVIYIRHRYQGKANEHFQYKLSFNEIPDGDSLTHMYESFSISSV
jgi:hypothetical protein